MILLADKVICTKDLFTEKGVIVSRQGDIWDNTYYGTTKTVRLMRKRPNGIPEWLTVPHDLLKKHFEEYKQN